MAVILLVRSREELTEEIKQQLRTKFEEDLEFIDVEPRTPEELFRLTQQHQAVAVLLRENPLPKTTIEAGIPCIPIRHGEQLCRLVSVDAVTTPL